MLCYYTLVIPGKMEQGNLKITTSLTSLTTQQVLAQPGYILHRDVVDDDDDNNNNNNTLNRLKQQKREQRKRITVIQTAPEKGRRQPSSVITLDLLNKTLPGYGILPTNQ